jgi:hypothetical protein
LRYGTFENGGDKPGFGLPFGYDSQSRKKRFWIEFLLIANDVRRKSAN